MCNSTLVINRYVYSFVMYLINSFFEFYFVVNFTQIYFKKHSDEFLHSVFDHIFSIIDFYNTYRLENSKYIFSVGTVNC